MYIEIPIRTSHLIRMCIHVVAMSMRIFSMETKSLQRKDFSCMLADMKRNKLIQKRRVKLDKRNEKDRARRRAETEKQRKTRFARRNERDRAKRKAESPEEKATRLECMHQRPPRLQLPQQNRNAFCLSRFMSEMRCSNFIRKCHQYKLLHVLFALSMKLTSKSSEYLRCSRDKNTPKLLFCCKQHEPWTYSRLMSNIMYFS